MLNKKNFTERAIYFSLLDAILFVSRAPHLAKALHLCRQNVRKEY